MIYKLLSKLVSKAIDKKKKTVKKVIAKKKKTVTKAIAKKKKTVKKAIAKKKKTVKKAIAKTSDAAKDIGTGVAALGVLGGGIGGMSYVNKSKDADADKPKTDKPEIPKNSGKIVKSNLLFRPNKLNETQAERLREQLKLESTGDRVKRSNPPTPKRATVTGKKDDMAGRNIFNDGEKKANVTREQLERLGLDPQKKSSLTTYLNAYDRLGRRPKSKADLAAKRNMGGMMKKKEAPSRPAGYMNGGMANKTSANKTSARSKPKGVGAATCGYGKAMR